MFKSSVKCNSKSFRFEIFTIRLRLMIFEIKKALYSYVDAGLFHLNLFLCGQGNIDLNRKSSMFNVSKMSEELALKIYKRLKFWKTVILFSISFLLFFLFVMVLISFRSKKSNFWSYTTNVFTFLRTVYFQLVIWYLMNKGVGWTNSSKGNRVQRSFVRIANWKIFYNISSYKFP